MCLEVLLGSRFLVSPAERPVTPLFFQVVWFTSVPMLFAGVVREGCSKGVGKMFRGLELGCGMGLYGTASSGWWGWRCNLEVSHLLSG